MSKLCAGIRSSTKSASPAKRRATILTPEMVAPGMHLNAVGGDCPGKTELHADILRGARVAVEYEPQTRVEGEIQQMPADFPVVELWRVLAGEAPGREEDRAGLPFVGRSGQLLDRMLAAIGLSRRSEDPGSAANITNTLPWRPPGNREPSSDEIAMMLPFLHRHIELKAPEMLLLVGAAAVRTLMQTGEGITRMRGRWLDWRGVPAIATFHPATLLRDGAKKREAWADLLTLRARLDGER